MCPEFRWVSIFDLGLSALETISAIQSLNLDHRVDLAWPEEAKLPRGLCRTFDEGKARLSVTDWCEIEVRNSSSCLGLSTESGHLGWYGLSLIRPAILKIVARMDLASAAGILDQLIEREASVARNPIFLVRMESLQNKKNELEMEVRRKEAEYLRLEHNYKLAFSEEASHNYAEDAVSRTALPAKGGRPESNFRKKFTRELVRAANLDGFDTRAKMRLYMKAWAKDKGLEQSPDDKTVRRWLDELYPHDLPNE